MLKRFAAIIVIFMCSFPALAAKSDACLDEQASCNQGCIAKGDLTCVEQCGVTAQKCVEAESAAENPQQADSETPKSDNSATNLQGCWRSEAKLTTWCFNGARSTITTDSYAGTSDGQRITELDQVNLSGSSMTYYIVRAKQTGEGGYDHAVRKGPYTQPYTYSDTRTPSFYAAGDQYVKQ